jgi:predicted MFS family arabinose efflux permease
VSDSPTQVAEPGRVSLGREFRLYATGESVSIVGDRIALIALIYLVVRLSHSYAPALALFYISRVLPSLIGGLFVGVLADHYNRKRLLIGCDLGCAVLLVAAPTLAGLQLWTIFPIVVVLYALILMFGTAADAALPDVVPRAAMTRANSTLQGINNAADLAYAVGGSMVAFLPLQVPFYIDAGTFLFSAIMIGRMRIPFSGRGPFPALADVSGRIQEGLRYLLAHSFLRWSTLTFTLAPLAGGAMFVLVPLYASHTLGHTPGLVGPLRHGPFRFSLLEVALGAGALLGSALSNYLARHFPRGQLVGAGILCMGVVDLSFAAIHNLYLAMAAMVLHGLYNSIFAIAAVTLVQTLTPSEVRGRVVATRGTIINLSIAIGSALGGLALVGIPYTTLWIVIGLTIAASSLFVWLPASVRRQR